MKLFTYIKSFFKKEEIIEVKTLEEMSLEELFPKHDEEEAVYRQKQEDIKTQGNYLVGINRRIAQKLSPVKLGDILELKSNNGVGRSVLIQQLFWDKQVEGPVPEINIICHTWKQKEHETVLNEKPFSISYPKGKKNDPFSVKSWMVRKNINDKPTELENGVKRAVKKVVK